MTTIDEIELTPEEIAAFTEQKRARAAFVETLRDVALSRSHTLKTWPESAADATETSAMGTTRVRIQTYEGILARWQGEEAAIVAAQKHYESLQRRAGAVGPHADWNAVSAAQAELAHTTPPPSRALEEARQQVAVAEESLRDLHTLEGEHWKYYQYLRKEFADLSGLPDDARSKQNLSGVRIEIRRLTGLEL